MEFMPANYLSLVLILNNLGFSLYRRFERTGSMEDLKKAIYQIK
jgi:hypothetical protein